MRRFIIPFVLGFSAASALFEALKRTTTFLDDFSRDKCNCLIRAQKRGELIASFVNVTKPVFFDMCMR